MNLEFQDSTTVPRRYENCYKAVQNIHEEAFI